MCPACMMDLFELAVVHPKSNRYWQCNIGNREERERRVQENYNNIIFLQNHLPENLHGDKSTDREKFDVLLAAMREGGLPQRCKYSEHPLEECPVYNRLTELEKRVFPSASPCTYKGLRKAVTAQMERATLYFLDVVEARGNGSSAIPFALPLADPVEVKRDGVEVNELD